MRLQRRMLGTLIVAAAMIGLVTVAMRADESSAPGNTQADGVAKLAARVKALEARVAELEKLQSAGPLRLPVAPEVSEAQQMLLLQRQLPQYAIPPALPPNVPPGATTKEFNRQYFYLIPLNSSVAGK